MTRALSFPAAPAPLASLSPDCAAPKKDIQLWNAQLGREAGILQAAALLPERMRKVFRRLVTVRFPAGPPAGDIVGPPRYFAHERHRVFSWLARRSYGIRFETPGEWVTFAIRTAQEEIGRNLSPAEAAVVAESVRRACRIRPEDVTGDLAAFAS